jgi:hypothetical protein
MTLARNYCLSLVYATNTPYQVGAIFCLQIFYNLVLHPLSDFPGPLSGRACLVRLTKAF